MPVWGLLALSPLSESLLDSNALGWDDLLVFIVVFPVCEEFLFRGLLLEAFRKTAWGQTQFWVLSRANLLSTGCFIGLHFLGRGLMAALYVAGPSLVLGVLKERSESLALVIAIHITWNAGLVLAIKGIH